MTAGSPDQLPSILVREKQAQKRKRRCHHLPAVEKRFRLWSMLSLTLILLVMTAFATTCQAFQQHRSSTIKPLSRAATTSLYQSSSTQSTSPTARSAPPKKWFPTKIQQDINYANVIQSLYLRHIVVETKETASLVMEQLLQSNNTLSFATLATQVSACAATKNEGGVIGWVDTKIETEVAEPYYTSILPTDVLLQLVHDHQPKTGDIVTLSSKTTDQVHIIKVEEVWLRALHVEKLSSKSDAVQKQLQANSSKSTNAIVVGAHSGMNAKIPRAKLKGHGVSPVTPTFGKNNDENNNNQAAAKTYTIQTNGCQMNVADSERLEGILQTQLGLQKVDSKAADVLIVNTCSIRDHAEQKLYNLLGPYRARKRSASENNLAIIVTGCVAQQEGYELLQKMPEIDVVLGPQYVPFLGSVLQSIEQGHQLVLTAPMLVPDNYGSGSNTAATSKADPTMNDDDFSIKPIRGHSVRAWVNAIYGCNEHCSYCVVPATRGMEQSRSMESILQECLDLIENQGYKEITLLGQNIDAYGRDMSPKRTFADLLHYLNANIPSRDVRIRYVTSHPRYFSDRVIDAVASLDKVCELFHMPFQAGSDSVLKEMRRGYTYDSYMKIIDKIRTAAQDAAITADVIVGFPGETEEDFQRTLDLMEEVQFDNLNSFAYSPRPNTEAALWEENQIPDDVKKERLARVQELAAKHAMKRSQRYLGRIEQVLVEDKNPRSPKQVMGRTRQGRQVYFDGDVDNLLGEFVNVKILEARTWSLVGEMV